MCSNDICIIDETIQSSLRYSEVEDLDEEDKYYAGSYKGYEERIRLLCMYMHVCTVGLGILCSNFIIPPHYA